MLGLSVLILCLPFSNFALPQSGGNSGSSLPQVDLGYEIHRAISFNVSL